MRQLIKWQPAWYDLDQTIVVGDLSIFYIRKSASEFANGLCDDDEFEVKAKVVSIYHTEIPDIKAIHCDGLSYYIYYDEIKRLAICCEENPGDIYLGDIKSVSYWDFTVEIDIVETNYISFKERIKDMPRIEQIEWDKENRKLQNELLVYLEEKFNS